MVGCAKHAKQRNKLPAVFDMTIGGLGLLFFTPFSGRVCCIPDCASRQRSTVSCYCANAPIIGSIPFHDNTTIYERTNRYFGSRH